MYYNRYGRKRLGTREKLKYGFILFLSTVFIFFVDFIINVVRTSVLDYMDYVSWMYYIPAALGHAALFALILYLIYILFALIFKSNKTAVVIYVVLAIILQMFIILDGLVFNLYRFHFNRFVLELILGGGSDIFVFDWRLCLKFTGLVLLAAVLPYLIAVRIAKRFYRYISGSFIRRMSILLILCVVVSHLAHAVAAAKRQVSVQKSATAMPFFFPLTSNTLLMKMGLAEKDELDELNYKELSDLQYPTSPLERVDSIADHNIVYIVIDSWNPSTFNEEVMPNIFEFSKKAHTFDNHSSSGYGTRSGIFGLFFGAALTYETEFNMERVSPLFVDEMVGKGYKIQAFPSANFTMPPFHEMLFRRVKGINTKVEGATPFERDNKVTQMAFDYIDNHNFEKPFYTFLFYDLAHAMSIPKEYRNKFQPSWDEADYMALNNNMDRTPFFNLYKNCLYHVDSLVGKVLKDLDDRGLLSNTVVVITGDHGQEFNENKKNYWGHGSNYSKWQLGVPLIVYYPTMEEGGKHYTHMTTHYDLSPTMMKRFFGVKNPTGDYSMGYDLYDTTSRYPHIVGSEVNYAFVFEDIIVKTNHLGTLEITDKNMNELSRKAINAASLRDAIEKKNKFFKK